ncbi:LuxR C-terminal-related transcriptional regulator [Microbacterium lushaniae]|uniref:LuxR family transcriptional regulator n=1 Tax=Microbacterium lushaniae TaxID=2614639 RepID=A0A5J6L1B4_9MICO|nr:LuxR C-terminal-related transcriptional regulator [Microbacterium lushaniae]QEW02222.1 LuxR family transcriptional regulator [Microbacterium lushaniae]
MESSTTPPADAAGGIPMILTRPARAHIDAVVAGARPPRLVLVGTAGSGKTRLLQRLEAEFAAQGRTPVTAVGERDLARVPAEEVLLIDDAHLLSPDDLAAIARRVSDPAAALVLSMRPWPVPPVLREIADALETTHPAIVLGHVTHADVLDECAQTGRPIAPACVDDILELAGHLTWLVSEALGVHDADCTEDAAHAGVREELRDLIAHRIAGLDEDLRHALERLCLSARTSASHEPGEWIAPGHAKGLLQRNGQPAPVVRDTVRATISIDRLAELYADAGPSPADPLVRELMGGMQDPRVATALLKDGDAALSEHPRRADELFRGAADAGADPRTVAVRRARAAWNAGEIDVAGALIDAAAVDAADPAFTEAAAITGAVWAARGDLRMASVVFAHADAATPQAVAHASLAALGSGEVDELARLGETPPARAVPSTLTVSHDLLVRGLRETLGTQTRTCLSDLVRATEMYTAAECDAPTPEIPAVLAAVAALSLGELSVAHTVIDTAVRARHGGAWAQPRLLLWQAWLAVQRERPHEAESALQAASAAGPPTPRERVLADAVTMALTRRYADASALAPAWRHARESILRTRFDLYSLLPLTEFAVSAARLGDLERLRPHLDEAYATVERMGSPPMWSSHLHWAGLHCAIHQNRPDDLAPHARGLLAAAPHTRLARKMARAGKVWTEVLTGHVDADAIEHAALGLASVGLAWDGARLAGHGAGRTEDRRIIARLLACARQLHPREELQHPPADDARATEASTRRVNDLLSAREREVAALVVQGKTYAEIGESIFISPRTAEHHIARIRRRLGATTRSDLIGKLRMVLEDAADAHDARSPREVEFA